MMTTSERQIRLIDRIVNTRDPDVLAQLEAKFGDSVEPENDPWDALTSEQREQIRKAMANLGNSDYWVSWEDIQKKHERWLNP